MTETQRELFERLRADRLENARVLEKTSMSGIKDSVVEKYSDLAHFVYELIQNADDAQATCCRFNLHDTYLIFAHNGTRKFSISDPDTEKADKERNAYGDLNAITAIANSNKNSAASIGKFGVGFKAVFQYTETPRIYDEVYQFEIRRFIVPEPLSSDHPDRRPGETLFVFPFNKPGMEPERCFQEIRQKLMSLKYPILFLFHTSRIDISIKGDCITYRKEALPVPGFVYPDPELQARHLKYRMETSDRRGTENFWMFSRLDENGREYCICYQEQEGKIVPLTSEAFCYFPTKERTNLKFLIHGPFLLTDSREGIRARIPYNEKLIQLLALLACDGIRYLSQYSLFTDSCVTENIMDFLPYNPDDFAALDDMDRMSFLPFYTAFRTMMRRERVIPADGTFISSVNAYWQDSTDLPNVFSNEDLRKLTGNPQACWVFRKKSWSNVRSSDSVQAEYMESIVRTVVSDEDILDGKRDEQGWLVRPLDEAFMCNQSNAWLARFYRWIVRSGDYRVRTCAFLPVLKSQRGAFVCPQLEDGSPNIFLPTPGLLTEMKDVEVLHEDLLDRKNPELYQPVQRLIAEYGVQEISQYRQIDSLIPFMRTHDHPEKSDFWFTLIFKAFLSGKLTEPEKNALKVKLKNCFFVRGYSADGKKGIYSPSQLYYPDPALVDVMMENPAVFYFDRAYYQELFPEQADFLEGFTKGIGIGTRLKTTEIKFGYYDRFFEEPMFEKYRRSLHTPYVVDGREGSIHWHEVDIDGLEYLIRRFSAASDSGDRKKVSLRIWNWLVYLCRSVNDSDDSELRKAFPYSRPFYSYYHIPFSLVVAGLFAGTLKYFYYNDHADHYEGYDLFLLTQTPWLLAKDGTYHRPAELTEHILSDLYDTGDSEITEAIFSLLSFAVEEPEVLPEEQEEPEDTEEDRNLNVEEEAEDIQDLMNEFGIPDVAGLRSQLEIAREAENGNFRNTTGASMERWDTGLDFADEEEADGWTSTESNWNEYSPEGPEEQAGTARMEKEQDVQQKKLEHAAVSSERYSYGWLKSMLQLEMVLAGESDEKKEVRIRFGRAQKEPGSRRTLILSLPSGRIPSYLQDLSDLPITVCRKKQKTQFLMEVCSVRDNILKAKIKDTKTYQEYRFENIDYVEVQAKSPGFLLENLAEEINDLGYPENYSLKENLPENMRFLFGPPGTGKTTVLADELISIMKEASGKTKRILVLTPTNKAADVIVRKIMERMDQDSSWSEWLIRFGASEDPEIERSGCSRDKSFEIEKCRRFVLVTTIARLPYDYFYEQDRHILLKDLGWDAIYFDESSMIGLPYILYALYGFDPEEFVISGDPFQIRPVYRSPEWKGDNIYDLAELRSFSPEEMTSFPYDVRLLTREYRSLPVVGEMYSRLTYGGGLTHVREDTETRDYVVSEDILLKPLSLIEFPVSRYESIYRSRKCNGSPYHLYSALFMNEFLEKVRESFEKRYPDEQISIGVISPYRTQAELIEKLVNASYSPSNVTIHSGTIHRFQGEECDVVFAMFNPPTGYKRFADKVLINQLNVINVAISRARNCLCVVMPDEETEDLDNLFWINRVRSLILQADHVRYQSHDLEEALFGDVRFIENSTFTTSHQQVNVYGLPEKKYEVRSDDNALDVQIHRPIREASPIRKEERTVVPVSSSTSQQPAVRRSRPGSMIVYTGEFTKRTPCPFDHGKLRVQAVPVKKMDGSSRKLHMFCCEICGKRFMNPRILSQSVHLEEYDLHMEQMGISAEPVRQAVSTDPDREGIGFSDGDHVFHPDYGKGQIYRQDAKNIYVQFQTERRMFNRARILKTGKLSRI